MEAGDRWCDTDGSTCHLLPTGEVVTQNRKIKVDYVIPYMMGYPGETGHIQALFEMMGMPYFGCSTEASLLCFNKVTQKLMASMIAVPQCDYICLYETRKAVDMQKAYDFLDKHKDVIIKPAKQGSSIGVSRATNHKQLMKCISTAFRYGPVIIIEQTITDAKEYLVSMAELDGQLIITNPVAVEVKGDIFDQESKYKETGRAVYDMEPIISPETLNKIKGYARDLFHHFQLRHLACVDFFITRSNEIYLIEINTLPGIVCGQSTYPMSLERVGYPLKKLFPSIIREQFQKI